MKSELPNRNNTATILKKLRFFPMENTLDTKDSIRQKIPLDEKQLIKKSFKFVNTIKTIQSDFKIQQIELSSSSDEDSC